MYNAGVSETTTQRRKAMETTKEVSILRLDEDNPAVLYFRYPGQLKPEPVYINLYLPTGRVWAEIGLMNGAQTFSQFHGIVRAYRIDPLVASDVNLLMEGSRPLLQRVLDGSSIEWNGNNYVGVLNDDAQAAEDEIQDEISYGVTFSTYEPVNVWQAAEYYQGASDSGHLAEYLGVTADSTDEDLQRIAEVERKEALDNGIHVIENLYEYIRSVRDAVCYPESDI